MSVSLGQPSLPFLATLFKSRDQYIWSSGISSPILNPWGPISAPKERPFRLFNFNLPASTMINLTFHTMTTLRAVYDVLKEPVSYPIAFAVFSIGWVIYQRWLSPLADVPGPFWASISRAWYFRRAVAEDMHRCTKELHKKYGKLSILLEYNVSAKADSIQVHSCALPLMRFLVRTPLRRTQSMLWTKGSLRYVVSYAWTTPADQTVQTDFYLTQAPNICKSHYSIIKTDVLSPSSSTWWYLHSAWWEKAYI